MGEVIISIIANVVLLSLVVLATYFGFKRYDKKLLDGKTISQNQILISITGALFVSMIGVFILNYIKIFLVWDSLAWALLWLWILVAQFFIVFYMIMFLLKQQKVWLEKKSSQLLARRLSFIVMISLISINIILVFLSILLGYLTM